MHLRYCLVMPAFISLIISRAGAAQALPDSVPASIHGRVHSVAGNISGADVLITPVGSRETWHGSSGSKGDFAVHMPASSNGYVLVVNASGYSPKRVTVSLGNSACPIDILLDVIPVPVLTTVEVKVQRRRPPSRDDGMGSDYAGDARGSPVGAGLSGDVSGNLNALVATIPGVSLTRDASGDANGFSVLGLGSGQNNAILNGVAVTAGDLPRDAAVSTQLSTSVYDAARGGFSGGQLAMHARAGSSFATRSVRLTVDVPALQLGDPLSATLGEQHTDLQLSGIAAGPAFGNRLLYNAAVQVGRQMNNVPSFLADGATAQLGIPDEIAQSFLDAANTVGIPVKNPTHGGSDNASAILRLDHNPSRTTNINLVATARIRNSRGLDASPFAITGYGQTARSVGGTLVGDVSSYIHGVVLNDLRLATSWSDDRARSNLHLPNAAINLNAGGNDRMTQTAALPGNVMLLAGGDVNSPIGTHAWSGEAIDEIAWRTIDNRHRFKITVNGRSESLQFNIFGQSLGTYGFNAISDFRDGRPAYFERTLQGTPAPIHASIGALSVGDAFQIADRVMAQYGARVDAGNYRMGAATRPDLSPLNIVDRTNFSFVGVSPRAGLHIQYGHASRLEGMGGEPRGTITFGAGAFRDVPSSSVLAQVALGGNATGASDLTCTGDAVAQPDWNAFRISSANVPTQCLPGFPSLSATGPTAATISPDFAPPVSWRVNAGWEAFATSKFRVALNGVYSITNSIPDLVGVNLTATPAFRLTQENDRPAFVPVTSIDTRTGSVNPGAARITSQLGYIAQLRNDLHAHTAQIVATIAPSNSLGVFDGSLNYTFTRAMTQQRGQTGGTTGDPRDITWARAGNTSQHQFNLIGAIWMPHSMTLHVWTRIASGTPFTPYVNQDINGDGFANDRAFVPDPASATSDPILAAQFNALARNAPSYAERCLHKSLGRIAGAASCTGPWTTLINSQLSFGPGFFRNDRVAVDISLINVPAAVDRLFHGDNVHGWGQSAFVDPVLLQVSGFDAGQNAYKYAVNPSFGRPLSDKDRLRTPFRMTIGARIALGPSRNKQLVAAALKLQPPRAEKSDSVKAEAASATLERLENTFPDVVQAVLATKDSIRLTPKQIDSLWALDRQFVTASDSVWTPMADYIARASMSGYSESATLARLAETQQQAIHLAERTAVRIKAILTAQQLAEFPPLFSVLLDERRLGSVLRQSYF